ncbi:tetratricopeptide repeat protein [Limnoglobus roseus]|uniref:Beta-barrel assembly-enhancing protease n=1 Tax=Limnoglobus roseus TaxID=2598579 RepID=A0A5C1AGW4_9BACT|nr:tetratricopeptide repeat protein [Limnoglobus roseus]QEL18060.1 Beta-barrel assembly-enhancing protease [Limnoglobus roseus]
MRRFHFLVLAVVLISPLIYLLAADPPKAVEKKPDAEQLVRDLGSPVFAVRDRASRDLWKLGEPARTAVEAATKSDDPEIAQRASDILEKFNWGIFPDTPVDVLKQIKEFRSDDPQRQKAAITALAHHDERGLRTLRLILSHEFEPPLREALFEGLLSATRDAVPPLLFDCKLKLAEQALELGTLGPNLEAWLDYAVFVEQHGRSPEAIRALEKAAGGSNSQAHAAEGALAVLLHLNGQSAAARKRLRGQPQDKLPPRFLASFLEDLGEWDSLIGLGDTNDLPNPGLQLFRARRARNKDKVSELTAELKKAATNGDESAVEVGIALFLNERPLDATAILREKNAGPRMLADVMAERLLFPEVLGLLGDGAASKPTEGEDESFQPRLYYDMRRARILAQLGRKDDSVQLFNQIGEQVQHRNTYLMREFLRASLRSGHYDLSAEHAGKFVAHLERRSEDAIYNALPDPYELLFDEDAEAAKGWWKAFRHSGEHREGDSGETMRRVRELLAGTGSPDRLKTANQLLDNWLGANENRKPEGSIIDRVRGHRARAATARLAGDLDRVEGEMRKAVREWGFDEADKLRSAAFIRELSSANPDKGPRSWMYDTNESFKVWLDLGDLLAERGKPAEAAKVFEQGWRQYPNNPILLYLSGKSLRASGDSVEGDRRIKLSHTITLGDAQVRGRFLHELTERGELADVKTESEWTRKCVWFWSPYRGNVWNQLSRSAEVLGDYETAAVATERNLHFLLLTPNIVFCDGGGYIRVPANIRAYRARVTLAAGNVAGAFAASKEVLQLLPAHTEFLTGIVPEFDRLKHATEADALFQITWAALQKLIRENPDSAWSHATAAQAAAGCRRELDAALRSAQRAVKLAPAVKWHQEVLAEVHFRRNDREAALKVMESLRRRDARSPYYKRLVERYKTADITSPALLAPEVD